MKSLFERLFFIFLSASVLSLAGCGAAPATQEGMTVQRMALKRTHAHSVSVTTNGGEETESVDSTNISNADFKAAIDNSIIQTNLFRNIAPGEGGEYRLNVSITQLRKSVLAGNYTVDLETAWSLVKSSDKSILLRKVIVSSTSVPAAGETKLRVAVESAAKNTIAQGLQAIANLELDPRPYVPPVPVVVVPVPVANVPAANNANVPPVNIPGFTVNQQTSFQSFLTKPLPRAFAISKNGGSGFAWGNDPEDKSLPTDPKKRALFICEKFAGQVCEIYMVDVQLVDRK